MRSRDTVKMQGFELAATLVPPSDVQNFFWGASAGPKGPPRKGQTLRLRSFPLGSSRGTISLHFYKGLCLPEASYPLTMQRFGPSHGTLSKMQGFWPAALLGPPSADLESENSLFK